MKLLAIQRKMLYIKAMHTLEQNPDIGVVDAIEKASDLKEGSCDKLREVLLFKAPKENYWRTFENDDERFTALALMAEVCEDSKPRKKKKKTTGKPYALAA